MNEQTTSRHARLLSEGQRQRPPGRLAPGELLTRAATAVLLGEARPGGVSRALADLYPGDATTELLVRTAAPTVLRAAVSPAGTKDDAWAGALASEAVGDFFAALPASAASRLFAAGLSAALSPGGAIRLPHRAAASTAMPWVPEGAPIGVRIVPLGLSELGPAGKFATIVVLSRELAGASSAPTVFSALLREQAALSLDEGVFNADPGTEHRPPGLLHDVTPIPGAAGGGVQAMTADLAALAGAVGEASGGDLAVITSPERAMRLRILAPLFPYPIWATRALPAGAVVGLDPLGFASGAYGEPEIVASRETILHQEDAAPAHVGTPGSGGGSAIVAAPTRSMFQTDCIALRLTAHLAFTMRGPGLVAVVDDATW